MRNVIVQEFVSLDGRAAGANDSVEFIPASMQGDQGFGKRQLDFMSSVDALLLGRVTYQMFAGYWPNVKDDADDKEFADRINATPKVVFSSTLDRAPWGSWPDARIVKTNASAEVVKMRQESGKDMVIWGSLSLADSLAREGLVDEYQLIVCPLALGAGRSLFRENARFEFKKSQTFDSGAVLLFYTPQR